MLTKTVARSIGCLNYGSVARQVMKVDRICVKVLEILSAIIQKELTHVCSRKGKSILRESTPEVLKSFTWDAVLSELNTHVPTLIQVLRGIVQVKSRV